MNRTKIPYCTHTWNPITGCRHGCRYCFARRIAERFRPKNPLNDDCTQPGDGLHEERYQHGENQCYRYGFEPTLHSYRLYDPIFHKRRAIIFTGDMGDMFGAWVPLAWQIAVLDTVKLCPDHIFLFLTKNPARYDWFDWPDNCWLGTTIEDQMAAAARLPELCRSGAKNLWISYEPGLGPVDLAHIPLSGKYMMNILHRSSIFAPHVSWVVAGGQTGPDSQPMHPDWVRGVRDECKKWGVPFFFKSWGNWWPTHPMYEDTDSYDRCEDMAGHPNAGEYSRLGVVLENTGAAPIGDGSREEEGWCHYQPAPHKNPWWMWRVGAKKAGRVLDGRTWDEVPSEWREIVGRTW